MASGPLSVLIRLLKGTLMVAPNYQQFQLVIILPQRPQIWPSQNLVYVTARVTDLVVFFLCLLFSNTEDNFKLIDISTNKYHQRAKR